MWPFSKKNQWQVKLIQGIHKEMMQNLESCHVMKQLGYLRPLDKEFAPQIEKELLLSANVVIRDYARKLDSYNAVLNVYLEYQRWYGQSLDHQSVETARLLHDKHEAAERESVGLNQVVQSACIEIEKYFPGEKK
jgi:hypothetical protein